MCQVKYCPAYKVEFVTDTGDESSCDSASRSMPTPPSCATTSPGDAEQRQRRSFFVRLKQRAQSRGDQPQYVLVHVVGHLRVPQPSARRPSKTLFILTCTFKLSALDLVYKVFLYKPDATLTSLWKGLQCHFFCTLVNVE